MTCFTCSWNFGNAAHCKRRVCRLHSFSASVPSLGQQQTQIQAQLNTRKNNQKPHRHQVSSTATEGNHAQSEEFDVSDAVVQPQYRSTPWLAEQEEETSGRTAACILFVSESNVCRSLLAEVIMKRLLQEHGLAELVICESKGTRAYCVDEGPDETTARVAEENGVHVPEGFRARQFDHENDIVHFDVVLVVDKFTAADVLREVSVYDTINKEGNYSAKVKLLGDFHPDLVNETALDGHDIDDPLYGNHGGEEEEEAIQRTVELVQGSCQGLLRWLQQVEGSGEADESFRLKFKRAVKNMKSIDWLVPPMLQPR